MRVLFIIDSLKPGGKERRLVALIKGLSKVKEVNMGIILLSKEIFYKDIFECPISIFYLKRDIRKDPKILFKFVKIMNHYNPDLVHGWDNISALHFSPICKLKGIPFINSMITSATKTSKISKRYIVNSLSYPFSTKIVSNSQAGLDSLFVPKKKQLCIFNGFDFKRIQNVQRKKLVFEKFGINRDKLIVGMVARFNDQKDYETLIRSAAILKGKYTFVAVGSGYNLEKMKILAMELGLKNFHFLGYQSDVESIINIFDIGVLLTNPNFHGEGISNSILEYMAFSKPVIATRGGGTGEIVNDESTGFLIEPYAPNVLAKKLKYLADNEELSREMGIKSNERIVTRFSIDRMINKTYDLYKKSLRK